MLIILKNDVKVKMCQLPTSWWFFNGSFGGSDCGYEKNSILVALFDVFDLSSSQDRKVKSKPKKK